MKMKNAVMLLLAIALVFPFSTTALAAELGSVPETGSVSVSGDVSPMTVHSYTKR